MKPVDRKLRDQIGFEPGEIATRMLSIESSWKNIIQYESLLFDAYF